MSDDIEKHLDSEDNWEAKLKKIKLHIVFDAPEIKSSYTTRQVNPNTHFTILFEREGDNSKPFGIFVKYDRVQKTDRQRNNPDLMNELFKIITALDLQVDGIQDGDNDIISIYNDSKTTDEFMDKVQEAFPSLHNLLNRIIDLLREGIEWKDKNGDILMLNE